MRFFKKYLGINKYDLSEIACLTGCKLNSNMERR